MLTLLSTLLSFLSGGIPRILDFFQDRQDKKHELALSQLQIENQLRLQQAGFAQQARVEEIHTEQLQITTSAEERQALYAHDIAIGQGASQWVINMRASVRPLITLGLFLLLVFVDIAGFAYAWAHGTDFKMMIDELWDPDTQQIWASVIAFWFGTQAFAKK